jgi:uncharacterized coiled-coil protein SlyX
MDSLDIFIKIMQIIIAIASFKGLDMLWNYTINHKKFKSKNLKDLYQEYTESVEKYMLQTSEMEKTITVLRNKSLEAEERMILMSSTLEEKNRLIEKLSDTITELNERIICLGRKLDDVISRAERLDAIKCEREGCDNRIPPTPRVKKVLHKA